MNTKRVLRCVVFVVAASLGGTTQAETVFVKYRGEVDLAPFTCNSTFTSSFIERICYDAKQSYMLIKMKPGIWYQYCTVPSNIVGEFLLANSKGSYYNDTIKGRFACRAANTPAYENAKENQ